MKPRLLDLFCGEGGCGTGYQRAGFEVVGVDHLAMPRYPFTFHKSDALAFLAEHGSEFDVIHASPPCQAYSTATRHLSTGTAPMLIDATIELLRSVGKPWIVENVKGAPLATATTLFGEHGAMLCGTHFGLRIWRHRLFETSFPIRPPGPCRHDSKPLNPHREESREAMRAEFGRVDLEKIWRIEAGVPWMSKEGGRQAIPPVFTQFIGTRLLQRMEIAA